MKKEFDVIQLDVPLFIRILEYVNEEVKDDVEIHVITQNILELCKGEPLQMDSYYKIIENPDKMYQQENPNNKIDNVYAIKDTNDDKDYVEKDDPDNDNDNDDDEKKSKEEEKDDKIEEIKENFYRIFKKIE